jgi:tetratricopeptide (TPR) repeat protein
MEQIAMNSGFKVWWRSTGLVLAALVFAGCALSPQAKEARFLEAGKKALARKEFSRAVIQFKNAIRMKKDDAEPYYQLGLAYTGNGEPRSAFGAFSKAAELDPKRTDVQVRMAALLITSQDASLIDKAEDRLDSVLKSSPEDVDALNVLGVAEWELGRPGEAEQHFQRVLRKFPNQLQANLNLSLLRISQKDFRGAEEILKKVASQQPPVVDGILALAQLYTITNRVPEAEQQYRRVIQLEPANSMALYDLGILLWRAGRADQAESVFRKLSDLPGQSYKPVHALFLFSTGKIQPAIEEFEKLAKADPGNRSARTLLVQAYWRARRPLDAERVLSQALRSNPKDVDALIQRIAIDLSIGDLARTQNDLSQVLRMKPESAEAHFLMARLHRMRGAVLQQRAELTEAVRLKGDFLQARLELTRVLIGSQAPRAALDVINNAPELKPQSSSGLRALPAIIERNWALLALGDVPELQKGIAAGLALARDPELLLQGGILKLNERNIPGARALIDEGLSSRPEDPRLLETLVLSYRLQKQPNGVLPALRAHAAKHPQSAVVQTFLGNWLLALGDRAQARAAFTTAHNAVPAYVPAVNALASLEAAEGRFDGARKLVLAAQSSRREASSLTLMMADIEAMAGNDSKALELFGKVLDANPNNVRALNNIAFLLSDRANKPDEALKYAQKAKELSPENPEIEDTLGWVLYRKGLYDLALKHLEAATANGSTPQRDYHLAMTCFKLGNQKRGTEVLSAALRANPNLPEAKLALDLQAQTKAAKP